VTARRSARKADSKLSRTEVAALMRRGYVRPIPEPMPLHKMGRATATRPTTPTRRRRSD
jgi:hypothetical protein